MPYTLNVFTGNFDYSAAGSLYWKDPVDTEGDLTLTDPNGTCRVVKATDVVYVYDGTTSKWFKTGLTVAAFSAAANAAGLSVGSSTSGSITSQTITLHPADASNPGAVSTTTQTFAGDKTFNGVIYAAGGIDVATTGGTDTLNIGANGADVINIGKAGQTTVNIYGTLTEVETANTLVSDKLITLNDSGAAASGSESGFEIEENGSATGYVKTSSDRNSFEIKAPNTAGIATITPGASGITLDQSSHNPVTVADTNSIDLTLSTQQVSGDVRISSNAADASNQLVNLNIESTGVVGLRAQIPDSSITGLISVADTNSVDMTYTSGQVSGDVRISSNAADASNTKVALNIESATSVGLRAQVPHAGAATEGVVNTTTQTFSGVKTFADDIAITGLSGSVITSDSVETSIEQLDESQSKETNTGFESWDSSGTYYTITGGALRIDIGGTGFIKGKKITWSAPQTSSAFSANTLTYVYIDSTGTIGSTTSTAEATFEDYIVLFEVLYDGTNYVVAKENHPYKINTKVSRYLHNNVGTVIRSSGAVITRVSTGTGGATGDREIKIVGADVLEDHGLETTIPDSSGVGVTWNIYYTNASGKWIRYAQQTELPMYYNNAGTPTALGTGPLNDNTVYTLYVSKDNLNSSTPAYYAVMNTAQYNTVALADSAIIAGSIARATNEFLELEPAQLGYAIVENNGTSGYINTLIVAKATFNSKIIGSGASTSSALISTVVTNFDGGLSATDTSVQIALETLDEKWTAYDINPTSFAGANNQVAAADVTGLLFSTTYVRAFEALVSVSLVADSSAFEVFTLRGVYNGSSWDLSQTYNGTDTDVDFTITNAGQVQYTSGNATGFVSLTIKFRAISLEQ